MFVQNKNVPYSTQSLTTILFACEDDPAAIAAAQAAELQAKIDTAVAAAVIGLKTKNDELLAKQHEHKERLKAFDGLDPAKIKALTEQMDLDEDLKLFSEGKKHEVIDKHTQRMRDQHKLDLEAKDAKIAEEAKRADAYRESVLDNEIRAVTGGLHKGAVDDALLAARRIFTLDAKGKAVQLDSEGRPVLGKDGKSPFSPAEWIETQKQLKPHWFPMGTSGAGGGGTRDAGSMGANFANLSATERLTAARAAGKK